MGRRLRIRHTTRVTYDGDARASYNEVRMAPLTLPGQTALENRFEVRPAVPVWTYWDYWGSEVRSFDLQAAHHELTLTANCTVETSPAPPLPPALAWADLAGAAERARLLEFLDPTPRTTIDASLSAQARSLAAGADPHAAAAALSDWVHDRVAYVPGVTGVLTSAQEAWDEGRGVCQDMAQLTVALMRATGLPARYVSGYLHPDPSAPTGETVQGQSHAWVEYWAGDWVALDPTNRSRAGECHVTVARGRDYTDVPPLRGIYHGAPSSTMNVTVEVTRLG
jgi:transglutaminase-like putative cysteine protease